MLLMSLGAMAVAITALGGTSMYPWMFLGALVVAGHRVDITESFSAQVFTWIFSFGPFGQSKYLN